MHDRNILAISHAFIIFTYINLAIKLASCYILPLLLAMELSRPSYWGSITKLNKMCLMGGKKGMA